MNTNISNQDKYRPEIDGIRAFAVIAVIINHFNKDLLPSGFLGVDIFFVISGYVITASLAGRKSSNFLDFISSFYQRRLRRLVPALLFFVLIFSLVSCLFLSNPDFVIRTGISSLLGISNLYLIKSSTDYFAQSTQLNLFTHTWSLGVEEQFYFIFPFLIWISRFERQEKKYGLFLLNIMLILGFISLLLFIQIYRFNEPLAYFSMPTRFWEIATGCIVFLGLKNKIFFIYVFKRASPLITLITIIVVMCLPKSFSIISTIFVVILSSVLITCLNPDKRSYIIFIQKRILKIGLLSYSLYLWHWGILSISRSTIGIHWWTVPFQLIFIYITASFSYKYIENPLRTINWPFKRIYYIAVSFLTISISSTSIFIFTEKFGSKIFLGDKDRLGNYSETKYWNDSFCNNIRFEKIEKYDQEFFDKCWFKSNNENSRKTTKNVFFYGNSLNQMLMPIPEKIFDKRNDYKFHSFYTYKCLVSETMRIASNKNSSKCLAIFKRYINYFENNSEEGDILVISSGNWIGRTPYDDFSLNGKILKTEMILPIYIDELKNLSRKIYEGNKKLVIVSPIPVLNRHPDLCSNWFSKNHKDCNKGKLFNEEENLRIIRAIEKLKDVENHGAIYLDIYSYINESLKNDKANVYKYYFDKRHLSRIGALKLTDFFENKVLNKKDF